MKNALFGEIDSEGLLHVSMLILINKPTSKSINVSIRADLLRIKWTVQIFPDKCYGFDKNMV